jgi:hypothetical protein
MYIIWQDGNDITTNISDMYKTNRHLVVVFVVASNGAHPLRSNCWIFFRNLEFDRIQS